MSIKYHYSKKATLGKLISIGVAVLSLHGCMGDDQSNVGTVRSNDLPSPTSSPSNIPSPNSSPDSLPSPTASSEPTNIESDSDLIMPLNDSGRLDCFAEDDQISVCPIEDYSGQDGEFGRDVLATEKILVKQGLGAGGFDFTKIDGLGNVLSQQNYDWERTGSESESNQWRCIKDNHTKLMWEVKSGNSRETNFAEHTYTWFSSDPLINYSIDGTSDGGECNNLGCDTEAFINVMNEQKYCGYSDWRLPTTTELTSIVDYSRINKAIDSHFFPNQYGLRHWTLNSSSAIPQVAWYVYFSDGSSSFTRKDTPSYIRLVRSDRSTNFDFTKSCNDDQLNTDSRYSVVAENEILDSHTNLIWQRCPMGFAWEDGECALAVQDAIHYSWQGALYAANDNQSWRLPNIKELESLVSRQCFQPAISWQYFSKLELDRFWTSTAAFFGEAWAIDFNNGGLIVTNKDKLFNVRLVKDN